MRIIEVDGVFNEDESEFLGFKMEDGTVITEFDGCDWKENPSKVLNKLTRKLKKGDELVEMADGSDTLWYGIIRAKVSSPKATRKRK